MKWAAILLLAPLACGQSDARGKRVIADALKALGGDRFLAVEDRVESGRAYSFYREQLTGLSIAKIYTRYVSVAEGKSGEELGLREKQAFGKDEDSAVVFREDGAWELTFRGSKPLEKERADRYRESTLRNIFYILRHRLKEPGLSFESRGADVVDHQPVEIVDIVDSQNRVVTVNFHQSTKLPVSQSWVYRDPKTKDRTDEVTRFSRYRDVGGGIQWPHQVLRERNGEKIYEIFSEKVTVNQDLTDNVFAITPPVPPPAPRSPKKK